MQEKTNISIDAALELVQNAFIASGLNEQSAQSVSRALVMAEAEGQVGHGFSRVGDYIAQMKSGKINANAAPSVHHNPPVICMCRQIMDLPIPHWIWPLIRRFIWRRQQDAWQLRCPKQITVERKPAMWKRWPCRV